MNDPYISIESAFTYEKVISRSVFIVTLIPVDTGEQAIDEIRRIRSRYSDATHNCYAYIASDGMRQSDDGEPQGTAGAPMLEVLRKRGVSRLLAVVTRYFGGIKLGAAGLVGAYGGCVAEALDNAQCRRYVYSDIVSIECGYPLVSTVTQCAVKSGAQVLGSEYGERVEITVCLDSGKSAEVICKIIDASKGKATARVIKSAYMPTQSL